jgi:hypothetical protein
MRQTLLTLAIVVIIVSLFLTGMGGVADMFGSSASLRFTKEHAWNDGVYLALVAIFLVLVAGLQK